MTIREIAQRCGVSRGTVDRVINGRGKVHPKTEALVRAMLDEVGYTKNIVGRALTVRKTNPVIGVILSSEGNPFFDEVIVGIRKAEADLADYGVTVALRTMRGYSTERQLALIDDFNGSLSALVMQPINDARIVHRIADLAENGIPTVTVNTDLDNSVRVCYVGSDYVTGGQTAAGVVALATGGRGRMGIITGVETILGHAQRRQAFESHLRAICPGMAVVARQSAHDDIDRAYAITRDMLRADPAIDTLMIITAGLEGVCRAVMESGREGQIRVFAFDKIPKTEEMMRRGLLKAVVCQRPYMQGYQSVRAAFDYILTGVVPQEKHIMENQIKLLENLGE